MDASIGSGKNVLVPLESVEIFSKISFWTLKFKNHYPRQYWWDPLNIIELFNKYPTLLFEI